MVSVFVGGIAKVGSLVRREVAVLAATVSFGADPHFFHWRLACRVHHGGASAFCIIEHDDGPRAFYFVRGVCCMLVCFFVTRLIYHTSLHLHLFCSGDLTLLHIPTSEHRTAARS